MSLHVCAASTFHYFIASDFVSYWLTLNCNLGVQTYLNVWFKKLQEHQYAIHWRWQSCRQSRHVSQIGIQFNLRKKKTLFEQEWCFCLCGSQASATYFLFFFWSLIHKQGWTPASSKTCSNHPCIGLSMP